METESLVIPGVSAKATKPRLIGCKACEDFGTVVIGGGPRVPRTMPEIMRFEMPCICSTGQQWALAFEQWNGKPGDALKIL